MESCQTDTTLFLTAHKGNALIRFFAVDSIASGN